MAKSKQIDDDNFVFASINNIPPFYHSSDLRNYFSQFIEDDGFVCCHFKHRPEVKKDRESLVVSQTSTFEGLKKSLQGDCSNETKPSREQQTFCCVAKVKVNKFADFRIMYHKKHWLDHQGNSIPSLCSITKVEVSKEKTNSFNMKYKTRGEMKQISPDREDVTSEDLQSMSEMNPPTNIMPMGNVGTPTRIFLDLIKQCKLPPKVIAKLGLNFPKSRRKRRYGNVHFQYSDNKPTVYVISDDESPEASPSRNEEPIKPSNSNANTTSESTDDVHVLSASGHEIESEVNFGLNRDRRKEETEELPSEPENTEQPESEEDADDCEEWERHEALNDDPANVERNKERLFEEPIELKWEKGGSGLVFYTDAQYWKEQEGDFDEQTADDLDVDMSIYYEQDGGDRDSRDLLRMRTERRKREGEEKTDLKTIGFLRRTRDDESKVEAKEEATGQFERHTKGIGRRVMKRHGWTDGQTLGSSTAADALKEALDNDGQHPKDKRGFGYYGEKLAIGGTSMNKKPRKGPIISTIYDNKDTIDPAEPLMRRLEPYHLKHRADPTLPYQAFQRPRDPNLKMLK